MRDIYMMYCIYVYDVCKLNVCFLYKNLFFFKKEKKNFKWKISKMEAILSIEDEDVISLEFIYEELSEQFKLILMLVERYKQKKPHLKQQFKANKQSWFHMNHLLI